MTLSDALCDIGKWLVRCVMENGVKKHTLWVSSCAIKPSPEDHFAAFQRRRKLQGRSIVTRVIVCFRTIGVSMQGNEAYLVTSMPNLGQTDNNGCC
jgi:hypothetical protein